MKRKYLAFIVLTIVLTAEALYFDFLTATGAQAIGVAFLVNGWWGNVFSKLVSTWLLASVVLWFRRSWLPAIILLVSKFGLLCNLIYFKVNGLFITWQVIRIAGNLRGFESSIFALIDAPVYILLFSTLLYVPILFLAYRRNRVSPRWREAIVIGIGFLVWDIAAVTCRYNYYKKTTEQPAEFSLSLFHPFRTTGAADALVWVDFRYNVYVHNHSIYSHLVRCLYDFLTAKMTTMKCELTPTEQAMVDSLIQTPYQEHQPSKHLIFILVESLTTEGMEYTDIFGNVVAPYLTKLSKQPHVLFAPTMHTQVRYGQSGDGQLITQTGLLPMIEGVTCVDYGANTYPNFAHFYPQSYIINPSPRVWNQSVVSAAYGYQHLVEPECNVMWTHDEVVFEHAQQVCDTLTQPTCMLILTISTHIPYNAEKPTMTLSDTLLEDDAAYYQCLRHTDQCIEHFMNHLDSLPHMKDATVVITSDHLTLYHWFRIPLFIKSPNISSTTITDTVYQCDIFPTILHAIDQRDYFWKGFGIDLLDNTRVRSISPNSYELSDKLIRMDYFDKATFQCR